MEGWLEVLNDVALFLGGGFVFYLIERWRRRPRVAVRLLEIAPRKVKVEVENLSQEPNSLLSGHNLEGWSPAIGGKLLTLSVVGENPRDLPPLAPRVFELHLRGDPAEDAIYLRYSFELLRIHVQVRRGGRKIIRVLDPRTGTSPVSRFRFAAALITRNVRAARREGRIDPPVTYYCTACGRLSQTPQDTFERLRDLPVRTDSIDVECSYCGRASTLNAVQARVDGYIVG